MKGGTILLKRYKGSLFLLILVLMFGLVFAACNADGDTDTEKPDDANTEDTNKDDGKDDEEATDDGPKEGGTVTGAMHTAPAGMFNPIFYEEAYEANILDFTHEGLTSQNEKLEFIPSFSENHGRLMTIKLKLHLL